MIYLAIDNDDGTSIYMKFLYLIRAEQHIKHGRIKNWTLSDMPFLDDDGKEIECKEII